MSEIYQYPLKIDKELMEQIKKIALDNSRSVNKEIEFALRQHVKSELANSQEN